MMGPDYDRRWVTLAAKKHIDLAWIEKLRKDFLTLLKNLPRVKDYQTAHELRNALRVYRKNFDDLFFENFMNRDLKYNLGLSESDAKWVDSTLRSVAWTFSSELSSMPIGFKDDYWNEAALFARFEREFPTWKARVQKKAQDFWKAVKTFISWYEGIHKKPVEVDLPSADKTVLEGFQLTMLGYKEGGSNEEELAILQEGLRLYRRRAAAVAPILLKKQLPVEVEFKATLDKGGEYHRAGYITFYASSVRSKGPGWVAHAMAHEMGHHLFQTYLSQEAQDFWTQTIRGDFGDLDIKELIEKWPGDTWAFQFSEKMTEDPVLALQVEALTHDRSYDRYQTKEDFEKLLQEGHRTIRVPKHPITGYANKNPEEAFCETIGLLVAYGPRAVHEKVRWWLNTVLPGAVKVAALKAASKEKPLHTFTSKDGDMESYVWEASRGGFNVTLKDVDSGNFLPTSVHTHDLAKAIATAKKWVG